MGIFYTKRIRDATLREVQPDGLDTRPSGFGNGRDGIGRVAVVDSTLEKGWLRGSAALPLKIDLQAHGERPAAGQFVVKIERVELVVLVRDVEQSEGDLGFPARETVTGKRIELPEGITRLTGIVDIVLRVPIGLSLGKETTGMIIDREQIHLI